jgi:hypothetical protein
MKKSLAIKLLGGTNVAAAAACGITRQAVCMWPDVLPPRIVDRVLAAQARRFLPNTLLGAAGTKKPRAGTPAKTRSKPNAK